MKKKEVIKSKKEITDIVQDIFRIKCVKSSNTTIDRLNKEIEIEEFFNNEKWFDEVFKDKGNIGVNITSEISDISLVKKIDFYLWAYFA